MNFNISRPLILFPLFISLLFSQTIDYFPKSFYGNLAGTAGSGLAIIEGANAVQINPAGISQNNNTEILFQIESEYYSYEQLNYLHNRNVGRTFYQNKFKPVYPKIFIKSQIGTKLGLGFGLADYLSPFLMNSKRAVTWSPIFNQTTTGVIRAATLGIGYNINSIISFGINISKYWGTVNSSIEGENHYIDVGKTMNLETSLSSLNMNLGAQIDFGNIGFGFALSTPNKFNTEINTSLSNDSLYKSLIPTKPHPSLEYPVNIMVGVAAKYFDAWQFLIDIKTYNVKTSNFSFNIYDQSEYKWKSGIGFNMGAIFSPTKKTASYRFGYVYRPQVLSINDIYRKNKDLFGIINTDQTVKHIFTIGSKISYSSTIIDFGFNYSILNWNRDYELNDYEVEEDYLEKNYGLFLNISLNLNKKGQV